MKILIGSQWKTGLKKAIGNLAAHSVVVITDSTVRRLYGTMIPRTLLLSFPAGEQSKNQTTVTRLQHAMLNAGCGRDTVVVALGGGVVGDIAGFVAATYHRGIPVIQVPTTLLAMVDSCVGGKTGINTPYGKNTIGAFWQPIAVCVNPDFLRTLDELHVRSGLLEAVKMFIAQEPSSVALARRFLQTRSSADAGALIKRALLLKTAVVGRDEREAGERMILNVGHTIGHAIEVVSGYRILHGAAVGLGMLVEARIAVELGIMKSQEQQKIEGILQEFGVHAQALRRFRPADIIRSTRSDKKNRGGNVRYTLLRKIGEVYRRNGAYAHPVPDAIVKQALETWYHLSSSGPAAAGSRPRRDLTRGSSLFFWIPDLGPG